jgi:hypothetical protein
VIAQNLQGLRRLRKLDPKVNLGLHISSRVPSIDKAKALGAEVLLPRWSAISPSFIHRAHCASMLVIPWTVDSPGQMRRTLLQGVDGIVTNYPARLAEAVARLHEVGRTKAANRILNSESGRTALPPPTQEIDLVKNTSKAKPNKRPSSHKEML